MSISNLGELKTAVKDWLNRTDIDSKIEDIIDLTQSKIDRDVKVREMNVRTTASVSTEYFDLPNDYQEMRNIQLNTNPIRRLRILTPEQIDTTHASSSSGIPEFYTIHGDEVQIKPAPDSTYTLEISYVAKLTRLVADAGTNWLLTNHPDIYLYCALYHAAVYRKDEVSRVEFLGYYKDGVDQVNKQSKRGMFSGSAPVIRSDTGTP